MKKINSRLAFAIAVVAVFSALCFIAFSFGQPKTNRHPSSENNPLNNNASRKGKVFTEKYDNADYGIEMDIPSGLTLREVPAWELVYDSIFPGNPEPDLALSVLSDSTAVGTSSEYSNYQIVLYKRTIDPKTLLGNHSAFNDDPGKPLEVFATGSVKIGGYDFRKNDFYSATMNGIHLYELAGNLDNGWTVYAWNQRTDNARTAVKDDDPNLILLKNMIRSLRFYKGDRPL